MSQPKTCCKQTNKQKKTLKQKQTKMSRHLKVLHSMKFHIGEIVSYSKLENSSLEWFQKSYNPGHNILEPYNILVRVRFTTSKTKRDI